MCIDNTAIYNICGFYERCKMPAKFSMCTGLIKPV